MADTKISALTALTGADADADTDLVPVVDTSVTTTKKMLIKQVGVAIGLHPGIVLPYAGSSAPTGWLLCYGQAVDRTTYADLFTAISTTYGVGDGATTFNLPDLRGRVVAGQDDMGGTSANRLTDQTGGIDGDTLGDTGGAETHTLTTTQMPAHTHAQQANTSIAAGGGAGLGDLQSAQQIGGTTQSAGGDGAHNNVQPTIILNYIIKT